MRELLRWAVAAFEEVGIESAQLDAELLLAHALGLSRTQLYTQLDRALERQTEESFRELISRRLGREPVAYILGHKEFYGLDFQVDRRVLIPRPETETLVEVALTIARQRGLSLLAEVGVGSGAVAIALAISLPEVEIYAIDSSSDGLDVAAENCRRHDVSDRVYLLHGDLLAPLPEPVELIVANLPYVSMAELSTLAPEITQYEPVGALDGGPDGLDQIRRLLEQAGPCLKPSGLLCLEIGATQALGVNQLLRSQFPEASVALVRDLGGLDRVVVASTGERADA
ncbi:MAG: peptide chain release factor N(5)-glutamine methyltransferase [Anaerolineae bacterium]|nr:peptide chain release factor N(5)-glutamine methyltransferase [Anaerolineae bacterium]